MPHHGDVPSGDEAAEEKRYPRHWIRLTLALWVVTFIFFGAYVLALHRGAMPPWLIPWLIMIVSLGVGFSILFSEIILRVAGLKATTQAILLAMSIVAIALTQSVIDHLLWFAMHKLMDPAYQLHLIRGMTLNLLIYIWIFALYGIGLKMLLLFQHIRERDAELARTRAAANRAELAVLRYQVQPEILFQTLSAASALVDDGRPRDAEALVDRLSSFMRGQLATDVEGTSTLADEMDAIDAYIALERARLEMEIELHIDCADALEDLPIPPFVIQPLIEMRVHHKAADGQGDTFRIFIRVHRRRNALILTIRDNGPALRREDQAEIFERLSLSSEGNSRLEIPETEIGFFARMELLLRSFEA